MLTKNDIQQIRGVVVDSEKRIRNDFDKKIGKVQTKLEDMDKFLDKELMADRRRIVKIEEKLQIQTA